MWEPPTVANPDFKGPFQAKMIDHPDTRESGQHNKSTTLITLSAPILCLDWNPLELLQSRCGCSNPRDPSLATFLLAQTRLLLLTLLRLHGSHDSSRLRQKQVLRRRRNKTQLTLLQQQHRSQCSNAFSSCLKNARSWLLRTQLFPFLCFWCSSSFSSKCALVVVLQRSIFLLKKRNQLPQRLRRQQRVKTQLVLPQGLGSERKLLQKTMNRQASCSSPSFQASGIPNIE